MTVSMRWSTCCHWSETSIEEHAVMSLRNAARYEWWISMSSIYAPDRRPIASTVRRIDRPCGPARPAPDGDHELKNLEIWPKTPLMAKLSHASIQPHTVESDRASDIAHSRVGGEVNKSSTENVRFVGSRQPWQTQAVSPVGKSG